jgi:hypothetical protein
MVFDVKYDLKHKARIVAGGNWTANDKEDIYSEVVRMDTVRIGFFLGELYGLSCCACDIGNAFLYGKTKEKVFITAGPEFLASLHGKNLIIDKYLYGLKTYAARFHEHLIESLLRLWFKKTKHDPDLWMVYKSSHHEYLAMYVNDILIWSKDPIAVIKSLEKTYMHVKECRHSRILFRWKCGIPWRSMEKSGIRIGSISKDLHPNHHSEIRRSFWQIV